MTKLLITGGQERENGFELGEGKYYKAARLMMLNTETGEFKELLSKTDGGENYPHEYPNLQYTAGWVEGNELWLPTDTEVMLYSYPAMTLIRKCSYPFFHNIHHVRPFGDKIAVISTGLDMVVFLDRITLEPLEFVNVEGKSPWHRFSQDIDYRQHYSTRPHDGHPNFIFMLNDEYWVTRCTQEDAVSLSDVSKRIDISRKKSISVHDGHINNNCIYFTSVDGVIIIADAVTGNIIEDFDVVSLEEKRIAKGWCRGLLIDGDTIYVGFSRLRPTRNRKKLSWLTNFSSGPKNGFPAHISSYSLSKKIKINEWNLPENSIDAIYSILSEPDA